MKTDATPALRDHSTAIRCACGQSLVLATGERLVTKRALARGARAEPAEARTCPGCNARYTVVRGV